jgi:hypothetical protein
MGFSAFPACAWAEVIWFISLAPKAVISDCYLQKRARSNRHKHREGVLKVKVNVTWSSHKASDFRRKSVEMSKSIHANLIPSALGSNGVASMVEPEPSSQNQSARRARRSGKVSESKEGHGDTVDIEKNDVKNERPIAKQATWFSTVLENGRKLTLNVIVLVAVILGVAAIGKATIKRSALIEPIGVPKELADRGFTGEAVAHHIVDELMILSKNGKH